MSMEQTLRLIRAQDLVLAASLAPPRDATGWSIAFQVKDAVGGATVLTKSIGSGVAWTDAGRGVLAITLARADTSVLTPSRLLAAGKAYVWEIARTDVGQHQVLARGQLILEEEITS